MRQQGTTRPFIRAGTRSQLEKPTGDWMFVDLGFAKNERSCAIADGLAEEPAKNMRFGELRDTICERIRGGTKVIHFVIEAPLSGYMREEGNPLGRSVEIRRGALDSDDSSGRGKRTMTRYWYSGAGGALLAPTLLLFTSLRDVGASCEIRVFEGFVSFSPAKKKMTKAQREQMHREDAEALRAAVAGRRRAAEWIFEPKSIDERTGTKPISLLSLIGLQVEPPLIMMADKATLG